MKLTKIFLILSIMFSKSLMAHGSVEEINCMLIEGTLEYRKPAKGSAVFEKIEENILSQKKKPLIDSGKISLQVASNEVFRGLNANVNIAFLDANHLVLGSSLNVNNKLIRKNQSQTQYFSKAPGDHFRIMNYLCNNTGDQLISNDLVRRSYTCVVIQSLNAHGFFKDTKKLESYLNGLKIKSIAPDLFTNP